MPHSSRLAVRVAVALVLGGCAIPVESEPEDLGTAQDAILGGYNDPGTGPDGVAHNDVNVVGIVADLGGGNFAICSGSLLAPNMVLTAHHCVADIMPQGGISCVGSSFGPPFSANAFGVTTISPLPMDLGSYHFVSEVLFPSTGTAICGNDVAILILSSPISDAEATPLLPRVDLPIAPGDLFNGVGFGGSNDTATDAGIRRRRDGFTVNCLEAACPLEDQVVVREWQGNEGTCEGDSGGPALDLFGRVTGVTSRGLQGCQLPTYGYVFGYADWLKSTAQHAAQVGGYAAPAWANGGATSPIGNGCADASTCPGGVCLDGYCSRPCSDALACDDGFFCNGDGVCEQGTGSSGNGGGNSGSGGDGAGGDDGGCGCVVGADPTKPVPWFTGGLVALACASLARRRSRSRKR